MELIALKLFRFALVGLSGMMIDFSLTWFFKEKIRVQKYVANAIGFICAASSNYMLNRFWTFESQNPAMAAEYSRFILVSAIGLSINSIVLYALVKRLKWNFYFSKLIAIGAAMLWNFSASFLYAFR